MEAVSENSGVVGVALLILIGGKGEDGKNSKFEFGVRGEEIEFGFGVGG